MESQSSKWTVYVWDVFHVHVVDEFRRLCLFVGCSINYRGCADTWVSSHSLISTSSAITMATTFSQFPCCAFITPLLTWPTAIDPQLSACQSWLEKIHLLLQSFQVVGIYRSGSHSPLAYIFQTAPVRNVKSLWIKHNSLGIFIAY